MHFQIKQFYSSNLLLVSFDFTALCICLSWGTTLFPSSAIMKLRIVWCLYICISSLLASHQIMWYNKIIHRLWHSHGLKITSCFFVFLFSEETKFEIDTTSRLITCSLPYYHIHYFFVCHVWLCIFTFFVNFIFTFTFDGKFICCKLFQK